jgi:hypothetical protein
MMYSVEVTLDGLVQTVAPISEIGMHGAYTPFARHKTPDNLHSKH